MRETTPAGNTFPDFLKREPITPKRAADKPWVENNKNSKVKLVTRRQRNYTQGGVVHINWKTYNIYAVKNKSYKGESLELEQWK